MVTGFHREWHVSAPPPPRGSRRLKRLCRPIVPEMKLGRHLVCHSRSSEWFLPRRVPSLTPSRPTPATVDSVRPTCTLLGRGR